MAAESPSPPGRTSRTLVAAGLIAVLTLPAAVAGPALAQSRYDTPSPTPGTDDVTPPERSETPAPEPRRPRVGVDIGPLFELIRRGLEDATEPSRPADRVPPAVEPPPTREPGTVEPPALRVQMPELTGLDPAAARDRLLRHGVPLDRVDWLDRSGDRPRPRVVGQTPAPWSLFDPRRERAAVVLAAPAARAPQAPRILPPTPARPVLEPAFVAPEPPPAIEPVPPLPVPPVAVPPALPVPPVVVVPPEPPVAALPFWLLAATPVVVVALLLLPRRLFRRRRPRVQPAAGLSARPVWDGGRQTVAFPSEPTLTLSVSARPRLDAGTQTVDFLRKAA